MIVLGLPEFFRKAGCWRSQTDLSLFDMATTRDQVLNEIRALGQATVAELAERVRLTPVAVRHHVAGLQAEGLVKSSEVRHGVGRPALHYSLTDAARERYPTRYVEFSERLLDELKAMLPADALEQMFNRIAEGIAAQHQSALRDKSLAERLDALVGILGREGFATRWNQTGESIALSEYNCPYVRIGQRHPEVCQLDAAIIRHVLDVDVEKTHCVLQGGGHCEFLIRPIIKPAG